MNWGKYILNPGFTHLYFEKKNKLMENVDYPRNNFQIKNPFRKLAKALRNPNIIKACDYKMLKKQSSKNFP